jgi:hypothetical protein
MPKYFEAGLVCAWFLLAGALSARFESVSWAPQILLAAGSFLALALCRTPPRG